MTRQGLCLILLVSLLCACNYPTKEAPSGASLIYTAAAETRQVQATLLAASPVASRTPLPWTPTAGSPSAPPTATPPPPATVTPPTPILPPTAGTAPPDCDQMGGENRALFVQDVTVPDGSQVQSGATFVKTWRLQNDGSCTWTSAYRLVYVGGDALGAPDELPLSPAPVAPGQIVDLSITFIAPRTPGKYTSQWKLSNAAGNTFGIERKADPFWVRITAVRSGGLAYDFVASASTAAWSSGATSEAMNPLTFGGSENDPNGAVSVRDAVLLETGAVSGKLLFTRPRPVPGGLVSGVFAPYTVKDGDVLRARLGFMLGSGGRCGGGRLVFQVGYQLQGKRYPLGEWRKTCDGRLLPIEVDLSSLRGQAVQFVLSVQSEGGEQDDLAIWNSPLIEPFD